MSPEVDLRDISRCQMHACMINALFSVSWATKCAHEAVTRGTTVHKTENNRGTNGVSGEVDYGPIMVQHVSHDLESSKSPAKSESWNNPRSTMLSRVAHMTMLSVVICVMNVWNQSCPTSVAKPESILWLLLQVYWQTIKISSLPCGPSTGILEQFVSILLMILQLIQVPPSWIDDHPSKGLKLYTAALSFFLPARSLSQCIFEHVLPWRKTTRLFYVRFFPPW